MKMKRYILAIDFVMVVGSLITIAILVGYTRPLVIGPIDDFNTTSTSVLFSFDKGNVILIDDNPEFSSPETIYAEDNLVIQLQPGVYYWKVQGALDSEIRKVTIVSELGLKLKRVSNESYDIVNSGNTELNVDVYNNDTITGSVVLGIDGTKEVSGTKFIGSQTNG